MELSPRNEMYQFNLAAVLLNQQKIEDAKAILTSLTHSLDPGFADHANQMLENLDYVPAAPHLSTPTDGAAPVNRPDKDADSATAEDRDTKPAVLSDVDKRPMAFVSGKIVSVDCSGAPAAVLTVSAAGRVYHLHVADREKLVLINADKFSCEWKDVKAAANYRDAGNLQGDLISLELP